ncbi:uncharacterized protein CEXT_756231 [Caerostris extrusa]|uniref:Uncharacterized protein n=1 Tax=Caerostris extrusa TaxID=172846 RepID=A0AAV4RM33_CAEEX|nr:uncharacterized protein CEXT_756231 [Caerostris extrusa]
MINYRYQPLNISSLLTSIFQFCYFRKGEVWCTEESESRSAPVAVLPTSFHGRPVPETSLYMMLQNFVYKVTESKDFYANLADRLCSDGQLVTKGDLNCWNGRLAE